MNLVPGTEGYERWVEGFLEATLDIPFEKLHQVFLPLIPKNPSRILDAGAGTGRDAFELSQLGHEVVAVEPLDSFHELGKAHFGKGFEWVNDALPSLDQLPRTAYFDFILVSGVWHHLSPEEQKTAMNRLARLMLPGSILAISLRQGPAGLGSCVYPIDVEGNQKNASENDLKLVFKKDNLPSLMKNKKEVTWTKMAWVKQ